MPPFLPPAGLHSLLTSPTPASRHRRERMVPFGTVTRRGQTAPSSLTQSMRLAYSHGFLPVNPCFGSAAPKGYREKAPVSGFHHPRLAATAFFRGLSSSSPFSAGSNLPLHCTNGSPFTFRGFLKHMHHSTERRKNIIPISCRYDIKCVWQRVYPDATQNVL